MDIFLYVDRGSWLHRLDPRTKVLGLLGLFIIAVTFSDPRYLLAPALFVLMLTAAARTFVNVRRIWPLLVLLFVYCLVLWPFFVDGQTPFLTIAGHAVSLESASFGLGMGLRLDVMLLGGILLLSTTTIEEFTLALRRLGLPAPMSFALSLAFRWVPSLIDSAGSIVQAQRARGLDLAGGNFFTRLRRYPPLLVPLIAHQLRQTRLLAMALESKGFGPDVQRQEYAELRMRAADWIALALISVALVISAWLHFEGYSSLQVRF